MTAFLESWGTGVSRMVEACKNAKLPEPEYGTDGTFVWITFKRPNSGTNSDTSSNTSSNTSSDTNSNTSCDISSNTNPNTNSTIAGLSDKQKEVLSFCIFERNSHEILEHIGVTYHSKNIGRFINSLVDAGLLKRTIPDTPNSPLQKYVKKRNEFIRMRNLRLLNISVI